MLLSHSDININASCGLFHTALTMAGSKGYTEVMSSLLKMPGINIHITNEQNEDAAQILCKRGKFQAFKLLYSHDKQIIHKEYLGGRTLLHSVFEHDANKGKSHGHRELLKLLLNIANFDANAQDDKLATPLHDMPCASRHAMCVTTCHVRHPHSVLIYPTICFVRPSITRANSPWFLTYGLFSPYPPLI